MNINNQGFTLYGIQNSQLKSAALLKNVEENIGFIPNIHALVAESPEALEAFQQLNQHFSQSHFDVTEKELIQIAISIENGCGYCVAGHSTFAEMQDVPSSTIQALRTNQPVNDPKLEALNHFTRLLVQEKGKLPRYEVTKFLEAGYQKAHIMELIIGIGLKTFTNIVSSLTHLPLDAEFSAHSWDPAVEGSKAILNKNSQDHHTSIEIDDSPVSKMVSNS